ncbi:MAG: hypothetical protein AAGB15_06945 [Pseudomonadota bacterium]
MAYVSSVEVSESREISTRHPTDVEMVVRFGEHDGRRIVQLDSYGSKERQDTDTVSQTFQLDEKAAKALCGALGRHFSFKVGV